MILLFNLVGLIFIVYIVRWFWLSKAKSAKIKEGVINVVIKDGVYTPARIEVPSEQRIVMEFTRKDNSACSETVIFASLNRQEKVPYNKAVKMDLGKLNPGSYTFTCQMKMYTGELIVLYPSLRKT